MINKRDHAILMAFLDRESHMFNWALTGEPGRKSFIERMFSLITNPKPVDLTFKIEGFNYIHIQSITNMGLMDSALILTADPWEWANGDLICYLPPSPEGGIGMTVRPRGETRC